MYALAPEMTADEVLQAFRHDAPNLFLGAVIVAVGLESKIDQNSIELPPDD